MKLLFSLLLGFFLLLCIPYEAESQSRSPVQDRRSIFRPTSQSRPPGGSRRPLQRSRRAMAMQYTGWEIGGNLGASYSLTDVSGNSVEQRPSFLNTQWSTVGLNAGVFGRYKFHPLFAVRVSVNYGKVHGADSLAEGRTRDFSFQNNIIELAATYEVYAPKSSPAFPFDFYGYLGLAAFYHNPDLRVPDHLVDSFEEDEYSNFQPAIPMGLGVTYSVRLPQSDLKIGYEVGWRKTFFDYLDGFTRPWSQGSDSYYFNKITVSYAIPDSRRPFR